MDGLNGWISGMDDTVTVLENALQQDVIHITVDVNDRHSGTAGNQMSGL